MNRRDFLNSTAVLCAGLFLPVVGCKIPMTLEEEQIKPDISFSNNDSAAALSDKISSGSSIIESSASNFQPVVIAAGSTYLTITPQKNRVGLEKSNGEKAFIRFGTIRTQPSIILERSDGRIIQESSIVPYSETDSLQETMSPADWLAQAVKVLSAALAIWIGASVIKLIASAVAYVALNILILALIVGAIAFMAWLLERTGWNFDWLVDLLRRGKAWIEDILARFA